MPDSRRVVCACPERPRYLRVRIPKNKKDGAAWLTIESNPVVSRGANDDFRPPVAFDVPELIRMYLAVSGLKSGYLFQTLLSHGTPSTKPRKPGDTFLSKALKRLLRLIGHDTKQYSGHSTRRTGAKRGWNSCQPCSFFMSFAD